jgi:hypothetical protein
MYFVLSHEMLELRLYARLIAWLSPMSIIYETHPNLCYLSNCLSHISLEVGETIFSALDLATTFCGLIFQEI